MENDLCWAYRCYTATHDIINHYITTDKTEALKYDQYPILLNTGAVELEWWVLDYTGIIENDLVSRQGRIICFKTKGKGFFSPELERFPSRQDLAIKEKL